MTIANGFPKPCVGFPSRSAAVRALRAEGLSNQEISERTGIPRSSIGALVPINPRDRSVEAMPRPAGFKLGAVGCISISVNMEIRQMLRPFAAKRGLALESLITDLIEKIAEDGLADAVMDDGISA